MNNRIDDQRQQVDGTIKSLEANIWGDARLVRFQKEIEDNADSSIL